MPTQAPAPLIAIDPKDRAKRYAIVGKIIAVIIGGLVFLPIAAATITGLAGLAVAAVIAIVLYFGLPIFGFMASNLALVGVKWVAHTWPVETLQNESRRAHNKVAEQRDKLKQFNAQVRSFGNKLSDFKAAHPNKAPMFEDIYHKMVNLLNIWGQRYQDTVAALDDFDKQVDEMKATYEMAKSAEALTKSAGSADEEFLAKFKAKEAVEAILNKVNYSFAEMDMLSLESTTATKSLPSSVAKDITVDVSPEPVKEEAKVQ
jgi:hypothetical protein